MRFRTKGDAGKRPLHWMRVVCDQLRSRGAEIARKSQIAESGQDDTSIKTRRFPVQELQVNLRQYKWR